MESVIPFPLLLCFFLGTPLWAGTCSLDIPLWGRAGGSAHLVYSSLMDRWTSLLCAELFVGYWEAWMRYPERQADPGDLVHGAWLFLSYKSSGDYVMQWFWGAAGAS